MDREVSIVLSPEKRNYRKVAQDWYGLTDEQMVDMDVHHNPARHEGGRNIPEHLYVYHNTLHSAVHEDEFVLWARKGSKKGNEVLHSRKDELGRSLVALKMNATLHREKDELGRSVWAVKAAEKLNAEKDEYGRSVVGVKAAERLHADKDSKGRSLRVVRLCEKLHEEKDSNGKSKHAVEMGKKGGRKGGVAVSSAKWIDPDHPELGVQNAGNLVQMQRSRGYPDGKENRVRVG